MIKSSLQLLKRATIAWNDDSITMHGAALSYFTVFSIAPLVLVAISIAGLVFGAEASQGRIFSEMQNLLGADGARSIQSLVANASQKPSNGVIATVLGFLTLILGASGVFNQLQQSLNIIWRVTGQPGKGLWLFVRRRLLTFSMVLVIGFILLVTLLLGAAISALGGYLGGRMPGGEAVWQAAHSLVSFGVVTALFAAMFKLLPDVELSWRDVGMGSVVTALLFTFGKLLIGLYLGRSSVASSYGAAGSLVIVLLWVFYASQIFYFGAEFTRARVLAHGKPVKAKPGSKMIDEPPSEAKAHNAAAA